MSSVFVESSDDEMIIERVAALDIGKAEIVQGSRFKGGGAREGGMPASRY